MKRWKLALAVAAVSVSALVLASRTDMIRFRRRRKA